MNFSQVPNYSDTLLMAFKLRINTFLLLGGVLNDSLHFIVIMMFIMMVLIYQICPWILCVVARIQLLSATVFAGLALQ